MKKIISLVLVLLTLTACGKKTVEPCLFGISFTADIVCFNESYKGECVFSEDGILTFKITEPELLSGYTVTISDDKTTAEYLGLQFTPNEGNMPFSSVADTLFEKLTAAAGGKAEKRGEQFILEGDSYTLYISESGLPQKMLIPDERFIVYFYNATAL